MFRAESYIPDGDYEEDEPESTQNTPTEILLPPGVLEQGRISEVSPDELEKLRALEKEARLLEIDKNDPVKLSEALKKYEILLKFTDSLKEKKSKDAKDAYWVAYYKTIELPAEIKIAKDRMAS